MKKFYGALMALVLMAAMVLPAMAAPSPQAEAKAALAGAQVPVEGAKVVVLTKEVFEAVQDVVTNPTHLTNLGVNTNAVLAAAFDLEITIPEGQESVTVPIKVNNAKPGDYVYILHRADDGTWSVVGQGTLGADLTANATFTSFSPVAIMVVDAAQAAAGGVKAPKTGQF